MTEQDRLRYRPCVGVMLVNSEDKVFVGQRIDNREGDRWQMPQGGVDEGEDLDAALFREIHEEIGVGSEHLQIVARLERELIYDLPPELQGKLWGGQYQGQRQTWYLVRFTGQDHDIRLDAWDHPEFCEFKWVDAELLPELIVPFKRDTYRAVVDGFRDRLSSAR